MGMPGLRNPAPRPCPSAEVVPVDHRHLGVGVGEHAPGEQPGDSGAEHGGPAIASARRPEWLDRPRHATLRILSRPVSSSVRRTRLEGARRSSSPSRARNCVTVRARTDGPVLSMNVVPLRSITTERAPLSRMSSKLFQNRRGRKINLSSDPHHLLSIPVDLHGDLNEALVHDLHLPRTLLAANPMRGRVATPLTTYRRTVSWLLTSTTP